MTSSLTRSPDHDPKRLELVHQLKIATEQITELCNQADVLVRKLRYVQQRHEWSFIIYNLVLSGKSEELDFLDVSDEDLTDMVQKASEYIFHLQRAFTYLTYALNHSDRFYTLEIQYEND